MNSCEVSRLHKALRGESLRTAVCLWRQRWALWLCSPCFYTSSTHTPPSHHVCTKMWTMKSESMSPNWRETSICSGAMEGASTDENPLRSPQTCNTKLRTLTEKLCYGTRDCNNTEKPTQRKAKTQSNVCPSRLKKAEPNPRTRNEPVITFYTLPLALMKYAFT